MLSVRGYVKSLLPDKFAFERILFEFFMLPWDSRIEEELKPILRKEGDRIKHPVCAVLIKKKQIYFLCYTGSFSRFAFNVETRTIKGVNLQLFLSQMKVITYDYFRLSYLSLEGQASKKQAINTDTLYLQEDEKKSSIVKAKWRTFGSIIYKDLPLQKLQEAKLPAFPQGNQSLEVDLLHMPNQLAQVITELQGPPAYHFSNFSVFYRMIGVFYDKGYHSVMSAFSNGASRFVSEAEAISFTWGQVLALDNLTLPSEATRFGMLRITQKWSFNKVFLCAKLPTTLEAELSVIYLALDGQNPATILAKWMIEKTLDSDLPVHSSSCSVDSLPNLPAFPQAGQDSISINEPEWVQKILFVLGMDELAAEVVFCKPDRKIGKTDPPQEELLKAQWKSLSFFTPAKLIDFLEEKSKPGSELEIFCANTKTDDRDKKASISRIKASTVSQWYKKLISQAISKNVVQVPDDKEDKNAIKILDLQQPPLPASILSYTFKQRALNIEHFIMDLMNHPGKIESSLAIGKKIMALGQAYLPTAAESYAVTILQQHDKWEVIKFSLSGNRVECFEIDIKKMQIPKMSLLSYLEGNFLYIPYLNLLAPLQWYAELLKISDKRWKTDELAKLEYYKNEWTPYNAKKYTSLVLIENILTRLVKKNIEAINSDKAKEFFHCFKEMLAAIDTGPVMVLDFFAALLQLPDAWNKKTINHREKIKILTSLPSFTRKKSLTPFTSQKRYKLVIDYLFSRNVNSLKLLLFYLKLPADISDVPLIKLGQNHIEILLANSEIDAKPRLSKKIQNLIKILQSIYIKYLIVKGCGHIFYSRRGGVENFTVKNTNNGLAIIDEHKKTVTVLQNSENITAWLLQFNIGEDDKLLMTASGSAENYEPKSSVEAVLKAIPSLSLQVPSWHKFFMTNTFTSETALQYDALPGAAFPPNAVKACFIHWNKKTRLLTVAYKRLIIATDLPEEKEEKIEIDTYQVNSAGHYESTIKKGFLLTPNGLCNGDHTYLVMRGSLVIPSSSTNKNASSRLRPLMFSRMTVGESQAYYPILAAGPYNISLRLSKLKSEVITVIIRVNDSMFDIFAKKAMAAYREAGISAVDVKLTTNQLTSAQVEKILEELSAFYKNCTFRFLLVGRGSGKLCNALGSNISGFSWPLKKVAEQMASLLAQLDENRSKLFSKKPGEATDDSFEFYFVSNCAAGIMLKIFSKAFEYASRELHTVFSVRVFAASLGVYTNLTLEAERQESKKEVVISGTRGLTYAGRKGYVKYISEIIQQVAEDKHAKKEERTVLSEWIPRSPPIMIALLMQLLLANESLKTAEELKNMCCLALRAISSPSPDNKLNSGYPSFFSAPSSSSSSSSASSLSSSSSYFSIESEPSAEMKKISLG
jgi:hypothetical protein